MNITCRIVLRGFMQNHPGPKNICKKTRKTCTELSSMWGGGYLAALIGTISGIVCHVHLYIYIVWTPCLMHRCGCIWQYILQNYNYKLHFQNLSIYHIPHVFIGTLATENLVGFVADIDIKILGVPPRDRACLSYTATHAQRGGLFISVRVFFPVWCYPWMDDGTDGWMDGRVTSKSFTKYDHDVFYYM
jgi:hypothetical protein